MDKPVNKFLGDILIIIILTLMLFLVSLYGYRVFAQELVLSWEGLSGSSFTVGKCVKNTTNCTGVGTVSKPEYALPVGTYGAACYRLKPAGGKWSDQFCVSLSKPGSVNLWSAQVTVPK